MSRAQRIVRLSLCLTIVLAWTLGRCSAAMGNEIAVRHFQPEPIRIQIAQLPPPYHTQSVTEHPQVVPPPAQPVLQVPEGFHVSLFAEVPHARWLALTPAGDVLCAASRSNKIVLLQDENGDGVAEGQSDFLDESRGANLPFGMAFSKEAFFLGNTDAVLRYPYRITTGEGDRRTIQLGDGVAITQLPGQGYNQHWTRNVVTSPAGDKLYVSVGSATNASVEELPRASVLQMNLDGSQRQVFAFGLRNPVGLAFHPVTGQLFTTVNERDGLGDDLVPDYLALLREGEFYGWPYAYFTPQHLDPRLADNGASALPELVARTQTPEVLFQSHSAALGLAFSGGQMFPDRYRNGAFVAFRGSWNRQSGTGYKLVFIPFDESGRPRGYYEDFLTGFLLDPHVPTVWGRPVGVLTMPDGSLLFAEEANGRVYRVWFSP